MVKNTHHKTAALLAENMQQIDLDPKSEGFYLLQRIQDEVHRFAVSYHRQLRSKNSLASRLDMIAGVGPKTRNKLLQKFGNLKKIRQASLEELQACGISQRVAQTIQLSLKNEK